MKKVILYGAGLAGEKFYWAYRKKYEIEYVLDRCCNRMFHNIPVYSFEEKKKDLYGHFVIVATDKENIYYEISGILRSIGMIELRDFISVQMVEKKLVVMYGNCHMIILEKYLQKQPEFQRRYVIKRYYIAEMDEKERYPSNNVLAHCKILISQDIQNNNSFKVPGVRDVIKKTSRDCINIIIPNLYGFNFFFPQVSIMDETVFERHINDNAINIDINQPQNHYTKYIVTWIIGWRDKNIESALNLGSYSEIKEIIENKEIYSKEQIVRNFKEQLGKLKQREVECSIKISDFIETNYKIQQLFFDPNHPCNVLICEKGKRILKLLNLKVKEDVIVDDALDEGELFIYGCVKKALEIVYNQEYIKQYRYKCTLHNHPLSLLEYIEEYLAWYHGQ